MRNPIANLSPTLQGLLLTLFSTLLFSCMHGLVRVLVDELHPFEVAFFRNLFGLVAVLPLLIRTGAIRLKSKQPGLQLLRSLIGVAAMTSWFYGLSVVPIATATALSFMSGIFASLAAIILLGEKMRLRRSIAVGMGFIGVLIILRPGMAGFDLHMLIVLFSALMWGLGVVAVKQLTRTDSTAVIVGWMSIIMTLISSIPAFMVWVWPTWSQLSALVLLGFLATIGHICFTNALKLIDATAVVTIDFARLIWATIIGYFLFYDPLDMWTWIGGVVIFLSGTYIVFREARSRDARLKDG